jgi:hypothetical protein
MKMRDCSPANSASTGYQCQFSGIVAFSCKKSYLLRGLGLQFLCGIVIALQALVEKLLAIGMLGFVFHRMTAFVDATRLIVGERHRGSSPTKGFNGSVDGLSLQELLIQSGA